MKPESKASVNGVRRQCLVGGGCLLLGLVAASAVAADAPQAVSCQLTLQKAVNAGAADGRDLEVSLDVRGGRIVGAFGNAPKFNKMPAELDVKGVAVSDGRLSGVLGVSIPWDGWVPKDGKPFAAQYTIEASLSGGQVAGKWMLAGEGAAGGEIAGRFAPPASSSEPVRLTLSCANATDHQDKVSRRGLKVVMVFNGGKGVSVRAVPAGSVADVACEMETPAFDLALDDGKLSGSFQVRITPQSISDQNPVVVYTYEVAGRVIGDGAGGSMRIAKDGAGLEETATFVGAARRGPPPPMSDCTYKLTLHHALAPGKFIDVYMASTGGRLTGGFASTPNFNNAMHRVDLSKLRIADGRIDGELGVTILPDTWVPRDHQPIPCALTLDANVANGEVKGSFKGTAGAGAVEGALEGALDDKVALETMTGMTIRLENGLAGSGNHMARAFVGVEIKDGKVVGGNVSNNHDKQMKGLVTGGEYARKGDEWTLKVEFTLTAAGSATLGKYVATAAGTWIGTLSAGDFTCTHEAGRKKEGSFWAAARLSAP